MRTRWGRRTYGLSLNMTPLIDVVFLLIIFFLVASQFARVEYEQEVDLPQAESGQAQAEPTPHRLVVHVRADESINIAGQAASVEAFELRLQRLLQEAPADQVEVRLRADRHVPYRAVEPLLLACAREGIWRVNFAVLPKQD